MNKEIRTRLSRTFFTPDSSDSNDTLHLRIHVVPVPILPFSLRIRERATVVIVLSLKLEDLRDCKEDGKRQDEETEGELQVGKLSR